MSLSDLSINAVAVIGAGSVGSGWATLMLAKGIKVRAYDALDGTENKSKALITSAWPAMIQLGLSKKPEPPFESIDYCNTLEDAVREVDVVLENVPENLELKQRTFADVEKAAPRDALILSSAGGIPASDLQSACSHPDRVLVMHPFNPSHLIPLVEIVPGESTSAEAVKRAEAFAHFLGKQYVTVNKEMSGHMVNRLQFALVREAIQCVMDGVATATDIDNAVRYGLAPRWLLMGGLHTFGMAGGPGGMAGIIDHAGPAIENWWQPKNDKLKFTEEVRSRLIEAENELAQGADFEQWVAWRDSQLVELLALQSKANNDKPEHKSEKKI